MKSRITFGNTRCLACGQNIINDYRADKHKLVLKAASDPAYLQEASGIKEDLNMDDDDPNNEIITFDDNFFDDEPVGEGSAPGGTEGK